MCYHLTMQVLHKVLYFLSVIIATILLGIVETLVAKHIIEFFTFDPYIEMIVIVICLITVLPISVYFLTSRLLFLISPKKDQIEKTKKEEDAKISEL